MTNDPQRTTTPHPLLPVIGELLRCERQARGLTQAVVAGRAGLRVAYLREIEHGRADPCFVKLARLASEGLGIPVKDLIIAASERVE